MLDLKDCSPAWAQALFLKRILALRAGATLFSCAWHQRLPSSCGDGPARLIKFSRAFLLKSCDLWSVCLIRSAKVFLFAESWLMKWGFYKELIPSGQNIYTPYPPSLKARNWFTSKWWRLTFALSKFVSALGFKFPRKSFLLHWPSRDTFLNKHKIRLRNIFLIQINDL